MAKRAIFQLYRKYQLLGLVYYVIPEDYDELDRPNAFPVAKELNDIRLRDVKQKFPLPGSTLSLSLQLTKCLIQNACSASKLSS